MARGPFATRREYTPQELQVIQDFRDKREREKGKGKAPPLRPTPTTKETVTNPQGSNSKEVSTTAKRQYTQEDLQIFKAFEDKRENEKEKRKAREERQREEIKVRQAEVDRRENELRAIYCPVNGGYTVWGCRCPSCKNRRLKLRDELMPFCPEAYLGKKELRKWKAANLPLQGKKKGKKNQKTQSEDYSDEDSWCLSESG
jgi:hypothetical protein